MKGEQKGSRLETWVCVLRKEQKNGTREVDLCRDLLLNKLQATSVYDFESQLYLGQLALSTSAVTHSIHARSRLFRILPKSQHACVLLLNPSNQPVADLSTTEHTTPCTVS